MRFAIYDAQTGGAALWGPETHTGVAVDQGQFVVQLGSVEALDGAIFDGDARWLEMAVRFYLRAQEGRLPPGQLPEVQRAVSSQLLLAAAMAGDEADSVELLRAWREQRR